MEVVQAAGDVVAEMIGGSDNDTDQVENGWERFGLWQWVSDGDSDRFDDEGIDDIYDSDEFDNETAEEEVVKKLDQLQSDYEWKWWTCSNEFHTQNWLNCD